MSTNFKDIESRTINYLKNSQDDYWHFSRKDSKDILLYTEKSSIYEAPTKEKFREGSDVLVRWTDGLLYLGNIIKVEDEYSRCAVKFEDGSKYWALYKDIHKGAPTSYEVICTICDTSTSEHPDEIVVCSKCSIGYHQLCHVPKIESSALRPNSGWTCRTCVFASVTKKGGAVKKGPKAYLMMTMKQTLPYDMQSLTWDTQHRVNYQQTYCYCGGPGEWHSKMLQCLRCKQWFHEGCLQCLDEPLLYGDRFYVFVCAICNKGSEFIRRLPLRWQDVAHLVLFNLTIIHNKKYFELDSTIMNFLKDKWSQLQVKGEELTRSSIDEKKQKMLEILQGSKSRFKCGKEVKKKTFIWGLISRVPPPVPAISVPETGPLTDEVLDSFLTRKKKKDKCKVQEKIPKVQKPLKKARKMPPHIPVENPPDTSRQNSLRESDKRKKIDEQHQQQKSKSRTEQHNKKLHHRRLRPRTSKTFTRESTTANVDLSDSEDVASSRVSLNTIIPQPTSFDGPNNPFSMDGASVSSNSKSSTSCSVSVTSSGEDSSNKISRKRTRKSELQQHQRITRSSSKHSSSLNGVINGDFSLSGVQDSKFLMNQNISASSKAKRDQNSNVSDPILKNGFVVPSPNVKCEKFDVVAKRIDSCGKVQYLIQWEPSS